MSQHEQLSSSWETNVDFSKTRVQFSYFLLRKLFFCVLLYHLLLQEFSVASKQYQFLINFIGLIITLFLVKLWLFSISFIAVEYLSHSTSKYIRAVIIFSSNLTVFTVVVDRNSDGTNLALIISLTSQQLMRVWDWSRLPTPKVIVPSFNHCPCSQFQRTSMCLPTAHTCSLFMAVESYKWCRNCNGQQLRLTSLTKCMPFFHLCDNCLCPKWHLTRVKFLGLFPCQTVQGNCNQGIWALAEYCPARSSLISHWFGSGHVCSVKLCYPKGVLNLTSPPAIFYINRQSYRRSYNNYSLMLILLINSYTGNHLESLFRHSLSPVT